MSELRGNSINITVFGYAPNVLPRFKKHLPKTVSLINPKYVNSFGFMVELLIDMLVSTRRDLHFNSANLYLADGFGGKQEDGSWNGMIGDLANDIAELSIPTLAPTPEREKAAGFIYPEFVFSPICFIVNPKPYISQVDLIASMDLMVWMGFSILYLLMAATVLASAHQHNLPLFKAIDHIYSMSFVQDNKTCRFSWANAALSIFWTFFVTRTLFIVMASTLFYQSQKPIPLPKTYWDLPGFMNRHNYKLAMFDGNWFYTQLMTSSSHHFVALRNSLNGHNFELLDKKSSSTQSSMIISLRNVPGSISFWDCHVSHEQIRTAPKGTNMMTTPIQNEILRQALAYNLNISDQIVRYIADIGVKYRQFGLVTKLERKYHHGHSKSKLKNEPQVLSITTFEKTFYLFSVAISMCVFVFIVELLTKNFS